MYSNFDFQELERATQENLARIYKESFDSQEYRDTRRIDETYRKVRQILECPEMEKCHPYLYSLDMDDFNDEDTEKINRIYDLGVDRGMFQKDDSEEESEGYEEGCEDGQCECDDALCGGPEDSLTGQEMVPQHLPSPRKPIYTVMYSAQKDGHSAMGEFYSMAPTIEGAKEDCMNQMGFNGYEDVMIMAVDTTYPGVEDGIDDSWVDTSLDNVSPNYGVGPQNHESEGRTIKEDDSEEYLKQETGDTSSEDEDGNGSETKTPEQTEDDSTENTQNGDTENSGDTESTEEEDTESTENDSSEEPKGEESGSEESEDSKDVEGVDGEEEEEKEGDVTEDEAEEDEKKLTAEEKTAMQTLYTKTFKDVLKKTGLEKSVSEMTLQERMDFYKKLAEKWDRNDPADFMNDKDQEKLNKIVVKADSKSN